MSNRQMNLILRNNLRLVACGLVALLSTTLLGQGYPVTRGAVPFSLPSAPGGQADFSAVEGTIVRQAAPGYPTDDFQLAPGEQLVEAEGFPGDIDPSSLPMMEGTSYGTGFAHGAGHRHGAGHLHGGICGSCGTGMCTCDAGCNQNGYAFSEALYFRREGDEEFTYSQNAVLGEFDYEWGVRATFGEFQNCFDAIEGVYTGQLEWTNTTSIQNPVLPLNAAFNVVPPFVAADLDTFLNNDPNAVLATDRQDQFWQAKYDSFELNQRTWGWDVVSVLYGVRYIDYREEFQLFSRNANGEGLFRQHIRNSMIGGQIGGDIYQPISLRGTVGLRGRAGLYYLNASSTTAIVNNGTNIVNTSDDEDSLAGLFELGVITRYQLTHGLKVTGGAEFWYLAGPATIPLEATPNITPALSTNLNTNDDVVFLGLTAGVEYWY